MKRLLLVLAAFVLPCATFAQTPSIEYTLSARNPISHVYDVQIEIRGIRSTTLDVAMPAWSPGVYAIRDFAGNVQQLEALSRQNRPLRLEQLDKQTWRISKGSDDGRRSLSGLSELLQNLGWGERLRKPVGVCSGGLVSVPGLQLPL